MNKPAKPDWSTRVQRFGTFEVLLSEALRAVHRWLRLYRVASRPLGKAIPEEPAIERECRLLTDEEMLGLPVLMPHHFSQDFIDAARQRGDVCLGAFVDSQLVAFSWRTYTTAPDVDGLWVKTEKPYRYSYKAFTLPEFRGKRVLTPAVSDPYCMSRGYTQMVGFVERHNLPSLQRHRRREGYIRLGYVVIVRLFGQRFIFHTPGLKRAGFRLYEPAPDQDYA